MDIYFLLPLHKAGMCPCYNIGDEFVFERDDENDHFWHGGLNTLVKTSADPDSVAGGPKMPHCSEAWDAISRYIYTGLQGGSIMKGWMKRENEMICCCSDGTRPVIFKIERVDERRVVVLHGMDGMVGVGRCFIRIKKSN